MQTYKIIFDDSGNVHIADEDGQIRAGEDIDLLRITQQLEFSRIGRRLMQDDDFATDESLITNIGAIIKNYYVERESFIEENHYRLLRLALSDTREDFEDIEGRV